jgi:hypothetical protein
MSSRERKNSDEFKSFLSDLLEWRESLYDYRKVRFGPPTEIDLFTKLIHLPNEEEFVNACQLIVIRVLGQHWGKIKDLCELGKKVYEKSSYVCGYNKIPNEKIESPDVFFSISYVCGYNKIPDGKIESPDVFFLISQRIEELPNKVLY